MDQFVFSQFHEFAGRSAVLDALIVFFASHFQYAVGALTLLLLFVGKTARERRRYRFAVLGTWLAAILARLGFTELIRVFYVRERPFIAYGFSPLVPHETDPSFPSGHAAFFFGMAFFLVLERPRLGAWFLLAALLIGAARVAAGVHYPLDILGGAAVGLLAAGIVRRVPGLRSSRAL